MLLQQFGELRRDSLLEQLPRTLLENFLKCVSRFWCLDWKNVSIHKAVCPLLVVIRQDQSTRYTALPPAHTPEAIIARGTDSSTLPATYNGCPDFNPTQTQNLLSDTLNKTMKAESYRVKSLMAASGSVVMAHRDEQTNKYYYRTTIRPSSGAITGVMAEFIEVQEIAGVDEEFAITSGEIVCTTLSNKYSFVELDATQVDGRIRKGTKVKLTFPDGSDVFDQLGLNMQAQSGGGC